MCVEGRCSDLFYLPGNSVRLVDLQTEIRTRDLSNTKQYC
jgi:hypothetical protein